MWLRPTTFIDVQKPQLKLSREGSQGTTAEPENTQSLKPQVSWEATTALGKFTLTNSMRRLCWQRRFGEFNTHWMLQRRQLESRHSIAKTLKCWLRAVFSRLTMGTISVIRLKGSRPVFIGIVEEASSNTVIDIFYSRFGRLSVTK